MLPQVIRCTSSTCSPVTAHCTCKQGAGYRLMSNGGCAVPIYRPDNKPLGPRKAGRLAPRPALRLLCLCLRAQMAQAAEAQPRSGTKVGASCACRPAVTLGASFPSPHARHGEEGMGCWQSPRRGAKRVLGGKACNERQEPGNGASGVSLKREGACEDLAMHPAVPGHRAFGVGPFPADEGSRVACAQAPRPTAPMVLHPSPHNHVVTPQLHIAKEEE